METVAGLIIIDSPFIIAEDAVDVPDVLVKEHQIGFILARFTDFESVDIHFQSVRIAALFVVHIPGFQISGGTLFFLLLAHALTETPIDNGVEHDCRIRMPFSQVVVSPFDHLPGREVLHLIQQRIIGFLILCRKIGRHP